MCVAAAAMAASATTTTATTTTTTTTKTTTTTAAAAAAATTLDFCLIAQVSGSVNCLHAYLCCFRVYCFFVVLNCIIL